MLHNAGYYHAAYIAAVAIYGTYAASIWWRWRTVRARLARREAEAGTPR